MASSDKTDRGYGWVVVTCAFLILFVLGVNGIMFSVFILEYSRYFERTQTEMGLIQATRGGLMFTCGTLTLFVAIPVGLLTKRYGCRPVVTCGLLLTAAGMLSGVFMESFTGFILSFSVLRGIGGGMTFVPSIVIVQQYFDKRRSIAAGITSAGLSMGTLVGGPLCSILIRYLGWRAALMVLAGANLQCLVAAALLKPPLTRHNTKTPPRHSPRIEDASSSKRSSSRGTSTAQYNNGSGPDIARAPEDTPDEHIPEVTLREGVHLVVSVGSTSDVEQPPRSTVSLDGTRTQTNVDLDASQGEIITTNNKQSIRTIIRNPLVWLYATTRFLGMFGMIGHYMFTVSRGVFHGMESLEASFLLTATATSSTFARVASGFLGQLRGVSRLVLYAGATLFGGGLMIGSSMARDHLIGSGIFAAVIGLTIGTLDALAPTVMGDIFGVSSLPEVLSICTTVMGGALFLAVPLGGWLHDLTGNYVSTFTVLGSAQMVGGILAFLLHVLLKRNIDTTKHKRPANQQETAT